MTTCRDCQRPYTGNPHHCPGAPNRASIYWTIWARSNSPEFPGEKVRFLYPKPKLRKQAGRTGQIVDDVNEIWRTSESVRTRSPTGVSYRVVHRRGVYVLEYHEAGDARQTRKSLWPLKASPWLPLGAYSNLEEARLALEEDREAR